MTKEESEAANEADIEFLKERLKIVGTDLLRSRDSNGRNILHKLFSCKTVPTESLFDDFIKQVLSLDPTLLHQIDFNGDTPIHVLVRQPDHSYENWVRVRIIRCANFIDIMEEEARNKEIRYDPPWKVQNADGNTPLLQALSVLNISNVFEYHIPEQLIALYPRAIYEPTNKLGENAFHLIGKDKWGLLEMMIEQGEEQQEAISKPDKNGVTPIMRALQGGSEEVAKKLLAGELLELFYGDRQRNPVEQLSIAIENKQFDFINSFLDKYEHFSFKPSYFKEVAALPFFFFQDLNRTPAVTPADLLGELDTVPPHLTKRLGRNPALRGIRSTWDIPRSQLQTYMGSMNVIAALLTTITFTAAFTVPGGLDQEKGFPLLLASKTFQVFMIADVVAMCLSLMVLFCLLWIVATNKRKAIVIQDFAISLLLASFVATLVTFMMGVYATIFPLKPWIAIATLVLCSILMLLVHRFVLINLFLPLMNALRHPIYAIKQLAESLKVRYRIHRSVIH